ncbi:endonuclease III domain-containing protein [Listeria floridensis]|uniref:endonuclease III domain-containing protein n=1 Tax=Listeria floridensis TaxID=1494962 RepID=UPI000561CD39|nr:deoxyribonuclease I [Listeria floridensis]
MITNINDLYDKLSEEMDHSTWWDTETQWEIVVGAVLVQNTNWKNVDYSLANIAAATQFDPVKLAAASKTELEEWIRPSGFYKNKSQTLLALFAWLKTYHFNLEAIEKQEQSVLREKLLEIRGIGPETADVLLVYVFNKVAFIADRYAQRIFQRLGVEEKLNYDKLQRIAPLPSGFTNGQARQFHGWLVDYGQIYLKSDEAWEQGFLRDFNLLVSN